jgi:hypothetical protein
MPRPRFTPGERTPGTHWTGGWVSPRAGLDAKARRKILCLCRGSNPGRPVRSQTLYWLSYYLATVPCTNIEDYRYIIFSIPNLLNYFLVMQVITNSINFLMKFVRIGQLFQYHVGEGVYTLAYVFLLGMQSKDLLNAYFNI